MTVTEERRYLIEVRASASGFSPVWAEWGISSVYHELRTFDTPMEAKLAAISDIRAADADAEVFIDVTPSVPHEDKKGVASMLATHDRLNTQKAIDDQLRSLYHRLSDVETIDGVDALPAATSLLTHLQDVWSVLREAAEWLTRYGDGDQHQFDTWEADLEAVEWYTAHLLLLGGDDPSEALFEDSKRRLLSVVEEVSEELDYLPLDG